jgi:hypothetical protein
MGPGRNRLAPGRGAGPQPAPEMVADRNFANVTGGGGMSSTESGMVSTGQDLWLIGPNDLAVEITSGLHYSSTDPYAVKISLDVDVDREVVWTVSRDLLAGALHGPEGIGDVRAWPSTVDDDVDPADRVLNIELGEPGECAHFAASAAAISAFLDETYQLVPSGTESDFLNLDAELAAWLDGA